MSVLVREVDLSVLAQTVGRKIVQIVRIHYQFGGAFELEHGPLEIYLDDGAVFHFRSRSSGDSLFIEAVPWVDSFAGPLTHENQLFVDKSGKWSRVPVSELPPFRDMIGAVVSGVATLENDNGDVAGLILETATRTLWFAVEGDEERVSWCLPTGFSVGVRHPGA